MSKDLAPMSNGPSLLRWFAVTGLPLGLLLAGYVLFEQFVLPRLQMRPSWMGGFWSYLGFMAFCYAFGFSRLYRIRWQRAVWTAPIIAGWMTGAGIVLTFAGVFSSGVAFATLFWLGTSFAGHLLLLVFISAPAVAGVAYALCLTGAQRLVEPVGEPLPRGWTWLHAVWGAVAGPSAFFGPLYLASRPSASWNVAQLDLLASAVKRFSIPWAFGVALFLGMWLLKRLQERSSIGRQA